LRWESGEYRVSTKLEMNIWPCGAFEKIKS